MSEQSSWALPASNAAAATSTIAEDASEANAVIQSINARNASQQTEILDFLRAL